MVSEEGRKTQELLPHLAGMSSASVHLESGVSHRPCCLFHQAESERESVYSGVYLSLPVLFFIVADK